MTLPSLRNLMNMPFGQRLSPAQRRERRYTGWLTCVAILQLAACGGSAKTSHYERAMNKQESCCKLLTDDKARSQCVSKIVRIEDESVEDSEVNEASFRCIEKNFVCERSTGGPTKESSQAALDCISDL